ncbi:MAG: hypothetical protein FP814_15395 [Desulfobacterium sp.]|nr:hypothetical protein [Desulfobacterium sp.]MBU3949800.1 hypothetical protein [Pseudomonadota bacterium]MBU4011290.1 hypothetical protein [Pseudomonadota bacterium]MBU4035846.1 hypothetical protein [Pseudomonadota bacterium]
MKNIIVILIIGFVLFEFAEHILFPLIMYIKDRKKKSVCGADSMIGKTGEIKYWKETEGKIFVNGELWRAVSKFPMSAGDRAVIRDLEGLTMNVTPLTNEANESIKDC